MDFIDKEICSECGGRCCKGTGCYYLPEDFDSMEYDVLLNLIKKGNISLTLNFFTVHGTLELYEKHGINLSDLGENPNLWSFYICLKARNINSDVIDFIGKKGLCRMLTDNGCKYNENERPSLGLSLIPKKEGSCEQLATNYSYEIKYSWIKYQDLLNKIVYTLTNKNTFDVFKECCLESEFLQSFYKDMLHYINPYDGIKAEIEYINKYLNKNIDEKVSVKKLIFK